MTSISKNANIDTLNKYSNTYHRTIKMNPADVKPSIYIGFNKGSKIKVGDHLRISNYKNVFEKGYVPNWSEEVFEITKVKNTVLWTTYVISDLKGEEIFGTFYKKELQKINQTKFRVKKVLKRKGDKLCVK